MSWLPRSWAWPVLLAAMVAGCFGGASTPALGDDGTRAGNGVLLGVVVDDAIRPLGGATVNLTGGGVLLNATTTDDGRFRFPDLEPGTYVVRASKPYYSPHEQAVVVLADVPDPDIVRFQLVFEPDALPFAQMYKHEGYHECGTSSMRVCSNVNIATWIVVCGQTGGAVCMGNVTNDASVFFQDIDGAPTFVQAELFWDATTSVGEELVLLIGGGTAEELKAGVGLPAYNRTEGPSPLMVRVSNHEGPNAWCNQVPDPPCGERAIENSSLGVTRALLGQVDAGPTAKFPACVPSVGLGETCGAGWSMLQAFTLYTTVFYGYEPPVDWLFTATGAPPDPPS